MEIPALQSHTPLWRRRASTLPPGATHPKFRPALGPFSQSSLCYGGFLSVRFAPRMAASSEDYSRRRPRKSLIPKTKSPTPKGFAPRTQVGTSIQKKEQTESEEKGQGSLMYDAPETRKLEVMSGSTMEQPTVPLDGADHKDQTESEEKGQGSLMYDSPETQKLEVMSGSTMEKPTVPLDGADHKDTIDRTYINGDHSVVLQSGGDLREEIASGARSFNSNDTDQVNQKGTITKIEEYTNLQETSDKSEVDGGDLQKPESVSSSSFSSSSVETGNQVYSMDNDNGTLTIEGNYSVETIDHVIVVEEAEDSEEGAGTHEHDIEDVLAKQKAEEDAQACKRMLEELAERNNLNESKIFIYPEVVKPDQTIAVFFNRNLSALMNEPDVLIMGAFNDWRWKSFTERLQKSDLNGDWWSCQLHVPKEAYKVDFVFFNGGSIYENNDRKDFCIPVEGGMDLYAFEDFLLEEKRRELEKLAAEQAEREREAEEQQRREVENAAREADKAQAKLEAEKKRNALHNVLNIAVLSVDNLWHIVPSNFKGGDRIRIFYSRSSRSLAHAEEIWIHGGHNNWNDGLSIVARLFSSKKEDGDWWYADVVVPDRAIILDWVFADGQPQSAKVYDNNNYQDFHAIVPNKMAEDLFWVEEENEIFKRLQEERRMKEEALRRKTEKTAKLKAETKQKTMKMFLLSQKHIFYTDPLDVQAGSTITVFYNPSNTVLSGKSDVWFRCSFNRWTHRNGPLRPQRMVLAGNGSLVKTSVKVPLDAYMMDFVFSDKEDGGTFDNRNGMDYHIPVSGGLAREPPMHIVHVSVEMAPIAKVGGLGDVVTSLSRAVQDLGHCVDIILPKYDCMNLSNVKDFEFCQSFPWSGCEIKVWFGKVEGLSVYFLEPENGMFSAGCIYGCRNDGERFGFFCHAALEFLHQKGAHPDILHCHDWSSAPVAWLFKEHYKHHTMTNARVIFTIHNLEFGVHQIGKAMLHADKATTVSYTYSKEVSGNPAIAPYHSKFYGILNGIDPDIWDPYNDNYIPVSYTSENVVEGKRAAKEALQQRLGLKKSDHPLVGIISRLTVQKGIHLIKHAICRTLERNGQVVLLGSAPDQRIQNDFVNLANQLHSSHADQVRLCLTYDEPLSHLIYAGSDFILVPSIFEPCGLTQLIAMRYGSIPIVRKTGGLYDTVFDVDNDKGRAEAQGLEPNGFSFDGADSGGVDYALNRAISAWFDGRDWFNQLCKRVMEQDWSWNRPALDYMELYHAARK